MIDSSKQHTNELQAYSLSEATNADFEFLYNVKKSAYKEYVEQIWGWDDQFQRKFHKDNLAAGNTKIIKAGNTAIGSVDVVESETNIFISGLYLLPDYQSKGIGTKIIKYLIREAEGKNKRLELEVLKVNTGARNYMKDWGLDWKTGITISISCTGDVK